MNATVSILFLVSVFSFNSFAKSTIACKSQVESAVVAKSDGEAVVTGIQSKDGKIYEVSFYWLGEISATLKAQVLVEASTCQILKINGLGNM